MRDGRLGVLVVLILLLSVPLVEGAVTTQAQEEGYHRPIYTDRVENAEIGETSLVIEQPALEVGSGNIILNSKPGGNTKLVTTDDYVVDAGSAGSVTFDGNIITGSSSLTVGSPFRLNTGTSVNRISSTRVNDSSTLITGNALESGVSTAITNAAQTFSEVLSEGNTAADGQRAVIDEVRARDADGLSLSDDTGSVGLFVDDGGSVGVQTASPTSTLTVNGQIQTATSSQQIYLPGGTGISQFVTSISGSGNDVNVPTTSAVDSAISAAASGVGIDDVLDADNTVSAGGTNTLDFNSQGDIESVNNLNVNSIDSNKGADPVDVDQGIDLDGSTIIDDDDDQVRINDAVILESGTGVNDIVTSISGSGDDNHLPTTKAVIDETSSTTDTNASTACSGSDTYLDGAGNCDDEGTIVSSDVDGYLPDDPAPSNVDLNSNVIKGLADPSNGGEAVNRKFMASLLEELGNQGCGASTVPASKDDKYWDAIMSYSYCGLTDIDFGSGEVTYQLRSVKVTRVKGKVFEVKQEYANHVAVCKAFLGGKPDSVSQYTAGAGNGIDVSYDSSVGVDLSDTENNVAYGGVSQDIKCTYNIFI